MMRNYRGGRGFMRGCPGPEKSNMGYPPKQPKPCQMPEPAQQEVPREAQPFQNNMQRQMNSQRRNMRPQQRLYPPENVPTPPIAPLPPENEPVAPPPENVPTPPIAPPPPENKPVLPPEDMPAPPENVPTPPIAPLPPENKPIPPIEPPCVCPPPKPPCVCPPSKPPCKPKCDCDCKPPCAGHPARPVPPIMRENMETREECHQAPTCEESMHYVPIPERRMAAACSSMSGCITDNQGRPAENDNHSLTIGPNGTIIMKDTYLIEKLAHFNRERIPERVVHANGSGAFGSFKTTHSMSEYTMADIFCKKDKVTPAFVRFSTVIGSKGSADTARDPRGFAIKLYTEEGNLDIVGNNLPVFFIRDAIKFPDLIHSLKPAPDTGVIDPVRFWDFYSQSPEATHMVTWVYSDRGTVKSFRKMNGFGVSTFCWVNSRGERFLVKYHFISKQGIETIDRLEAERLAGIDPNIAKDDLYETLQTGHTVEYEMNVQIMPICDSDKYSFDPLDDTKTWPEKDFPLKKVGVLTLSRNFENQFVQVEQAAFCPANLVNGIEFSDDKMLVGRDFAYSDAQRYRVGANFADLPVNSPRAKVDNFQQDGPMRSSFRQGTVNYSPSSCTLGTAMPVQKAQKAPFTAQYSAGNEIRSPIEKQDDFSQAGERFRGMTSEEKCHLVDNIACELCFANDAITDKSLEYFTAADATWGAMQAEAIAEYRSRMA